MITGPRFLSALRMTKSLLKRRRLMWDFCRRVRLEDFFYKTTSVTTTAPNATLSTTTRIQHNKQANMSSNQHYNYTGGRVSCWDIKREVETVSIHGEVTAIEDEAFGSCFNLTTVTIPDASSLTTIGNYAFSGCKRLQSINIPSSVTTIGRAAFAACVSLESITLP